MPNAKSLTEYLGVSYHQIPLLRSEVDKLESDDSASSIDGEDIPLGKKKHSITTVQRIFRSVSLFLVLTGYILLIANVVIWTRMLRYQTTKENESIVVYREYGDDLRYQSLDHDYDFLWEGDLADTNGAIFQPGKDGELKLTSISMFHQLHCLAYIRKTLQKAHAGEDVGVDYKDDAHWPHCFLYLRQAIMCYADDNLEYPQVVDGVLTHTISGMHDVRKCGNSQHLYDFRDEWNVDKFNITIDE